MLPEETLLTTWRRVLGLLVPTPTFPVDPTTKAFDPIVATDAKRFVEDAVVEKEFVVVALVVVAFAPVKFWKVEEAVARKFAD